MHPMLNNMGNTVPIKKTRYLHVWRLSISAAQLKWLAVLRIIIIIIIIINIIIIIII
jgi:hypothetical protein